MKEIKTLRDLIKDITLNKEEVDNFLNLEKSNWAKFDPELGYTLRNIAVRDGEADSTTISNYSETGERKMINYFDRNCRINTYGDSFTQCHQVSDGETWQEYLAAHFGEPIRNFGIGGYGVYQAYRRMLRHEAGEQSSPYIIFNIFDDDHYRSIDRWRWIRIMYFRQEVRDGKLFYFHANPWSYMRIDKATGDFVEYENPYNTPEMLYKLCDEEYVYETFKDDLIINLELAKVGGEFNKDVLKEAAEILKLDVDLDDIEKIPASAEKIHTTYALRSTMNLVNKMEKFAKDNDKKILYLLSYGTNNVIDGCRGNERFDKELIDFFKENKINYIDAIEKHKEDFNKHNLSDKEYLEKYFVYGFGHYNPVGNHFFAFSIKNELVNWLEPKPFTYIDQSVSSAKSAGYLA